MERVATWPAADRAELFRASAAKRGLSRLVIEKDFWVCWTLQRLFALDPPPARLIFKGGTSLAKVFRVIERFSEDIDISVDRNDLGFGGNSDPSAVESGKRREKRLDSLANACREFIRHSLLPRLRDSFGEVLGRRGDWDLYYADDVPDEQTLIFQYPSTESSAPALPAYIRPMVRVEFGARSDHWPACDGRVVAYAAEDFPESFGAPGFTVRALSAHRTFWEKATILHAWYHAPESKPLRDRQSRHYYDLVRMYEDRIGREALADKDLLAKVVEHKKAFFKSASAQYSKARPGTFRLVPPAGRQGELRRDYLAMREMIFGPAPSFEEMLAVLAEMESAINGGGRG